MAASIKAVNPISKLQIGAARSFDVQKIADTQLLSNMLGLKTTTLDTVMSVAFANSTNMNGNVLGQLCAYNTLNIDTPAYDWRLETLNRRRVTIVGTPADEREEVGKFNTHFTRTLDRYAFGPNDVVRLADDETEAMVMFDPVIEPNGTFTYTFRLNSDDSNAFIAKEYVTPGKTMARGWSEYSEVSDRGNGIEFASGIMLRNHLNIHRKSLEVTRSLHNTAKMYTMPIYDPRSGEKKVDVYGPDLQFKLLYELRREEEIAGWYGKPKSKGRDPKTNKVIYSGAGLLEQVSSSNRFEYNGELSYKFLTKVVEQLTPLLNGASGKVRVTLGGGRRAMTAFEEMTNRQAQVRNVVLNSQTVIKGGDPSSMILSGFYRGIELLNGDVEVFMKHVPLFDDPEWNSVRDSNGDLVSSYRMVLLNIGEGKDDLPNVSRIVFNGGDDGQLAWYVPGSIDPYTKSGKGNRQAATGKDGYDMHGALHSGFRLGDPTAAAVIDLAI